MKTLILLMLLIASPVTALEYQIVLISTNDVNSCVDLNYKYACNPQTPLIEYPSCQQGQGYKLLMELVRYIDDPITGDFHFEQEWFVRNIVTGTSIMNGKYFYDYLTEFDGNIPIAKTLLYLKDTTGRVVATIVNNSKGWLTGENTCVVLNPVFECYR